MKLFSKFYSVASLFKWRLQGNIVFFIAVGVKIHVNGR